MAWPAGKRRNPDRGNWGTVRLALRRFVEEHYRGPGSAVSYRALARALGVSDRTVRRWLVGTSRPPVLTQEAVEQWIYEQREKMKP